MRYAPLHNHTSYSIKDALPKPVEYVKRIYEYNESQSQHEIVALAITDHSNMYAMIDQHLACTQSLKGDKQNRTLKCIYGNEIYVIEDYDAYENLPAKRSPKFTQAELDNYNHYKARYHLVVLAKGQDGLESLFDITTEAGTHKVKGATKDFQLVEEKYLNKHGKGLIGLSACSAGRIGQLIIAGKYEEAKKWAVHYDTIFDEFYLEIQPHDSYPDQVLINNALIQMNQETGIPLVITSDSHYIYKQDKAYHDIMKQIDNMQGFTTESHMWTPDELIDWCNANGVPLEAIENTAKIADSCTADITPKDTKGLMPEFECPPGYTSDSYLIKVVNEGFKQRFTVNDHMQDIQEYINRLYYELGIIIQMGFADYFLILWDWFKWCKQNDILLGPGRGSAAGSLVAYFLDITKIDPIKNGLIFERFLNPERLDEPDIDTDISKLDRPRAIKYLEDKYGAEFVCQIATFGQYKIKNTIKAVLSAERGFTAEFQNSITKQIPDLLSGNQVTYDFIEDVVNNPEKHDDLKESEVAQCNRVYTMLQDLFTQYPDVGMAVKKLCGAINSIGAHAGGVVISSKVLKKHIPLMKGGASAVLRVCQTNMDGIHYLRGLKIDALGLKTLSQISECIKISNGAIPKSWLDNEDTDDDLVYAFLRDGYTANVFQMAKHVPTQMIKDFLVKNLPGLNAVNAGNRPGPLAKGEDGKSMVDRYVEAVISGVIPKIHPKIDPILEETMGQIWYQEQCMAIGQVMAGYSLGMSDLRIRKPFAKKQKKLIPEIRNEFVYGKKSLYDKDGNVIGISDEDSPNCIGAVRNGFSEELALKIFKDMEAFAAYAFNKSHSAAYAFVGYRTAWLSYYFPVEWSVACMTLDTIDGKTEAVTDTLNSCKKRGIKILPPDINKSESGFSVGVTAAGEKAVRFGLLGIKDVGTGILEALKEMVKTDGEFTSFKDFYDRCFDDSKNKTLIDTLVKQGNYTMKTDKNGNEFPSVRNPFGKRNIIPLILSGAFDEMEPNRYKTYNEYLGYRKVKAELDKDLKDESSYMLKDKLSLELDLLGYYVSQHPLDGDVFPYIDLSQCCDGQKVKIAGLVRDFKKNPKPTKSGKTYYKLLLEFRDGTSLWINIWDNIYAKYKSVFKGLSSAKKEIVIVEGAYSDRNGFKGINVNNILRIISKQEELEEEDMPEVSDGCSDLVLDEKESPMEDDIFMKVGGENG